MNLLHSNDTLGKYPDSWYAATAKHLDPFPILKGAKKYDVCIVGAGYTGLSTALHLSKLGYSVAVLEAHRVGFGASGRNGGQLGAGQRVSQDELVSYLGEKHAHNLWLLAKDAVNTVKEIIKTNKIDCHLKPGVATLGFNSKEVKGLHQYAEYLEKTYNYDGLEKLDHKVCSEICGSEKYKGGSLDMNAAHLHPLRFVFGLAKAAIQAGADIFEKSEVTSLLPGKVNRALTISGEIQSEFVVLGCNGYLGNLEQKVAAKVIPINNFIVATHTTHMSLLKAIKKVKKNNLIKKLKLLHSALRNQLNIKNPKILVTGLNPHAGENNMFGNEEIKFIIPAINELKKLNILVDGPIPADTALLKDNMNKYDCIYYMFHDQALCAFKALFFDTGVNLTLGLPIIRTSVDHGTAEELVGKKDKISIKSFLNALNIAQKFSQE